MDVYVCPECDNEFSEPDAHTAIRKISFCFDDDAIQATSYIHCPHCGEVVLAMFDSMECSPISDN